METAWVLQSNNSPGLHLDLEDSSEIYLPGECPKKTVRQNPEAQTLQAEEEAAAYAQMFAPLLTHILGAGNWINWADATPRVQSPSSCRSVSCKAHLHIVQLSGAFYTTAALPVTDYHLGLHRKDRRLDLELMLRWRAYTVAVQRFPSGDSSFIPVETGQIH